MAMGMHDRLCKLVESANVPQLGRILFCADVRAALAFPAHRSWVTTKSHKDVELFRSNLVLGSDTLTLS